MKWILISIISVMAAALTACGQQGPLYLSGHPPPSQMKSNKQNIASQVNNHLSAAE
jgi:predicted small lipoprotein YifL